MKKPMIKEMVLTKHHITVSLRIELMKGVLYLETINLNCVDYFLDMAPMAKNDRKRVCLVLDPS